MFPGSRIILFLWLNCFLQDVFCATIYDVTEPSKVTTTESPFYTLENLNVSLSDITQPTETVTTTSEEGARLLDMNLFSSAAPELCFEPLDKGGICKARMYRYYYNSDLNKCEEFIYSGCDGNSNRFMTKEECEKTCYRRTKVNDQSRLEVHLNCRLEVQLLDKCMLTSNKSRIAACAALPLDGNNEKDCLNAGCCWHNSFEICYNYAVDVIKYSSCLVLNDEKSGFILSAMFQSMRSYDYGWVGYLTFNKPVSGEFCILKDRLIGKNVIVGDRFMGRRGVIVQGTRKIHVGQMVNVLAAGSYGGAKIPKQLCAKSPVKRRKPDNLKKH